MDSDTKKCPTCYQTLDVSLLDHVTNYQTKNELVVKGKIEMPYHSLMMPWIDKPKDYLHVRVIDKETGKETLKRPLFLMHATIVRVVDKEKRLVEVEPLADSPRGANYLASGLTGWEMMRFFFLSRTQVEEEELKRSSEVGNERGYGSPFNAWWFKLEENAMRRASPSTLAMMVAEECPYFGTDLHEKQVMDIEPDQKAIIGYEYFDGEAVIKIIRALLPSRYEEIKGQLYKYKYGDKSDVLLLE